MSDEPMQIDFVRTVRNLIRQGTEISAEIPARDWLLTFGPALLAALDAVTAERDRYRAALAPLVAYEPIYEQGYACPYCGSYLTHPPDCPIAVGRAVLAPPAAGD